MGLYLPGVWGNNSCICSPLLGSTSFLKWLYLYVCRYVHIICNFTFGKYFKYTEELQQHFKHSLTYNLLLICSPPSLSFALFIYMHVTFSIPLESKLHKWWSFIPKYFTEYFLKLRILFYLIIRQSFILVNLTLMHNIFPIVAILALWI